MQPQELVQTFGALDDFDRKPLHCNILKYFLGVSDATQKKILKEFISGLAILKFSFESGYTRRAGAEYNPKTPPEEWVS